MFTLIVAMLIFNTSLYVTFAFGVSLAVLISGFLVFFSCNLFYQYFRRVAHGEEEELVWGTVDGDREQGQEQSEQQLATSSCRRDTRSIWRSIFVFIGTCVEKSTSMKGVLWLRALMLRFQKQHHRTALALATEQFLQVWFGHLGQSSLPAEISRIMLVLTLACRSVPTRVEDFGAAFRQQVDAMLEEMRPDRQRISASPRSSLAADDICSMCKRITAMPIADVKDLVSWLEKELHKLPPRDFLAGQAQRVSARLPDGALQISAPPIPHCLRQPPTPPISEIAPLHVRDEEASPERSGRLLWWCRRVGQPSKKKKQTLASVAPVASPTQDRTCDASLPLPRIQPGSSPSSSSTDNMVVRNVSDMTPQKSPQNKATGRINRFGT